MTETTIACPDCDTNRIDKRVPQAYCSDATHPEGWHCTQCDARFDEPAEREKRGGVEVGKGNQLCDKLANMTLQEGDLARE